MTVHLAEKAGTGGVLFLNTNERVLFWQAFNRVYAEALMPEGTLVVDVGGGSDPHPGAHIIVDKFIEDNRHRMGQHDFLGSTKLVKVNPAGEEEVSTIRFTVVCGDIMQLPFADKQVDFIIARHILEHVEDVQGAMAELSRVAKAGYIEMPTVSSEVLFPQGEIHRWTFTIEHGQLVAHSIVGYESPFKRMGHDLFANDKDFKKAWVDSYYHFHVCMIWKGQVTCEIGQSWERGF